jgi:hypothetical protein
MIGQIKAPDYQQNGGLVSGVRSAIVVSQLISLFPSTKMEYYFIGHNW